MRSRGSSFDLSKPATSLSPKAAVSVLTSYTPPKQSKSSWSRIRQSIREPMAELAGVAIYVLFGTGVTCQVALSRKQGIASFPQGDFLSINFGWAAGWAMGAWVSGGISGCHLNPAFTLALATWRGFPWRKVPSYIFAQVLGGALGAGIVYGNFVHAINIFEGGNGIRTQATASLFASYPLDYMTNFSGFINEFLGTAVLVFLVLALIDKKTTAPPNGLLPLTLFILLLGLGSAIGMQTYSFNPAHDLGCRLFLTTVGYGKQLYVFRHQYWLWCSILGPVLGAQVAVLCYDLFLKEEPPSPQLPPEEIVMTPRNSVV